jgi:ferrous iron transport protein B
MDMYMSKIGLSGKNFIPMILGFGCNVPAILSTRIIENKRERFATILSIPFMSCSARLPVYILLISVFIDNKYKALILLIIYLIGIGAAIATAKILRSTVFKGDVNPLLMELPDYTFPSIKNVVIETWESGKHFISRAGTVILAASIILWALTTFPRYGSSDMSLSDAEIKTFSLEKSYMGYIGKTIEPATRLMGGDWRVGSAFIASLASKEVFISQLGILFSLSDATEREVSLEEKIKGAYTLPAALSFIIFILLSAPCIATFAVIRYETGAWRWSIFQFIFMTVIAFSASVIVFQLGSIISG